MSLSDFDHGREGSGRGRETLEGVFVPVADGPQVRRADICDGGRGGIESQGAERVKVVGDTDVTDGRRLVRRGRRALETT